MDSDTKKGNSKDTLYDIRKFHSENFVVATPGKELSNSFKTILRTTGHKIDVEEKTSSIIKSYPFNLIQRRTNCTVFTTNLHVNYRKKFIVYQCQEGICAIIPELRIAEPSRSLKR